MKAKPFTTLDDQVEILRSRNVYIGDESEAKRFLLMHGYYSVVNGYKEPLLDRGKTHQLEEDHYRDGTTFSDFEALYLFDAMLRLTARDALDVAESTMKTASVYAFCYYHPDTQSYLDPASYISASEYYDSGNYTRNLIRLLGTLQSTRDNKTSRKSYVQHHIDKYRAVPLWVISQTLTFGNMSAFYDLQKLEVQNATCRNIERSTGKAPKTLGAKDVRRDYKVLTAYRNICSHGERFYCAKAGIRGQYNFDDLLRALKHVLPAENFSDYAAQLIDQLNTFAGRPEMKRIITEGLGVDEGALKRLLHS